MIYKLTKHTIAPAQRRSIERLAQALGLEDLDVWTDYYLEVASDLSDEQLARLALELCNPVTEQVKVAEPFPGGRAAQVAYKRGIVDNENDSLIELGRLLDVPVVAGKVARTYVSTDPRLREVVRAELFNASIEEVHLEEPAYDTLMPRGAYTAMETWDLRGMSDEALAALGKAAGRNLDLRQMKQIQEIQRGLGQEHVTDVLLEALDARWSDHCSHTTWRSLGNLLGVIRSAAQRTANPNILSMFVDNAGIWKFYDGEAIAFKAETHNGPSAISAYFGQLTKLGGVLRDIIGAGLGADPIGSFEYTATGLPEAPAPIAGRPGARQIANETIRAIKEYGNTFGVPMMSAHLTFHPKYAAKPFALGGSIGLIPERLAAKGKPLPGDVLLVIGGLTGNDGIHGASASSAGGEMDQAAVQIGAPLEEVKFRHAVIDLRDAGCLRALTDVGGAGLNSAVGELGEACGVWLNTALVPLKTHGLPMWRILLSESQERMVLAVIPEELAEARQILARHSVRNAVVGRFTGRHRYQVLHDPGLTQEQVVATPVEALPLSGEVGIDVPYELLDHVPEPREAPSAPARVTRPTTWPRLGVSDLAERMVAIVRDVEVADQRYAIGQYDSSVQGRTVYGPLFGDTIAVETSYWAAAPLYGRDRAVLTATSFNPWLYDSHPVLAARQHMLGVIGKLVLAGAAVQDICLCDNFYTPHREEGAFYWLAGMVREIAALSEALGTPFISGKDSSAGSVQADQGFIHVPPAVFLSALGKVPDIAGLRRNGWTRPGNLLVRIGPDCSSAAGTVAGRVLGIDANDVDELSVAEHKSYLSALASLSLEQAPSGCPIEAGGMLAVLLKGALASGYGAEVTLAEEEVVDLLREHRAGALIEVPAERLAELPGELRPRVIGRVTPTPRSLRVCGQEILSDRVIDAWSGSFRGRVT